MLFCCCCTSHICFIDEIPSWKGALCQLNHQHFPRSFWKTIRIKYLLVRTALDNCSKGVSLCQAPWKPLLWDWRQKQPCIRSCAKTRMNLPWDTPRANRNSLGEPQGKFSWVWLCCSTAPCAGQEQNKAGSAIGCYSRRNFTKSCLGNMQ